MNDKAKQALADYRAKADITDINHGFFIIQPLTLVIFVGGLKSKNAKI